MPWDFHTSNESRNVHSYHHSLIFHSFYLYKCFDKLNLHMHIQPIELEMLIDSWKPLLLHYFTANSTSAVSLSFDGRTNK